MSFSEAKKCNDRVNPFKKKLVILENTLEARRVHVLTGSPSAPMNNFQLKITSRIEAREVAEAVV